MPWEMEYQKKWELKKKEPRKSRPGNGNRRKRKMKAEMKQLRQKVARVGNKLHRSKQKRKATRKEKMILKELRTQAEGLNPTTKALIRYKEIWIDHLRYKKFKLGKMIGRGRRIMNNDIFEKDQRNFYRRIENSTKYEGKTPEVDKFVNFWGGIWEKDEKVPIVLWIEEAREALKAKMQKVEHFIIKEEVLSSTAKKNKNWASPGIDGIQNYWWKKFESAQRALARAYGTVKEDNNMVPQWWPVGRTVILPRSK